MIWDSLISDFQLEITGDEDAIKIGGVAIWHFISNPVSPSTSTCASVFKAKLELKKMTDFRNFVRAYHTWTADARTSIIKEEGEGLYNKYVRSMFYTYLMMEDEEFVEATKVRKRPRIQGKQSKV